MCQAPQLAVLTIHADRQMVQHLGYAARAWHKCQQHFVQAGLDVVSLYQVQIVESRGIFSLVSKFPWQSLSFLSVVENDALCSLYLPAFLWIAAKLLALLQFWYKTASHFGQVLWSFPQVLPRIVKDRVF